MPQPQPTPAKIFEIGFGFMASKTLLSAVELDLFTLLARSPLTAAEIQQRLELHPRSVRDFLDALVSMELLNRTNDSVPLYSNTADTDLFLDKSKPTYQGGILVMSEHRLYPFWARLTDGLKSGKPQNELADNGEDLFSKIYADEALLEQFLQAMAGAQMANFMALAKTYDFAPFESFCDVGGATGALAVQVASHHSHLDCSTFDLPPVAPLAKQFIQAAGLAERVEVLSGDFFVDPLPRADVITMGNILHDWDEEQKLLLLQKAYDALPSGGVFIAIEMVIDEERRHNTMGLLMSLNMLIETPGGFDYTPSQFDRWARHVGFERTQILPLVGASSAAVAIKA